MKKTVTRNDVLESIIKLINEYREECVEEEATLGRIHIGLSTVKWMYDWLCAEYSELGITMKMPNDEELKGLLQGDTIGTLADIAMKHITGSLEYDDGKEDKTIGQVKKEVQFQFKGNDGISAYGEPCRMTRDQFLEKCGEFYDARGTHLDDFEFMQVKLNV